jgi:hypothetical protein
MVDPDNQISRKRTIFNKEFNHHDNNISVNESEDSNKLELEE